MTATASGRVPASAGAMSSSRGELACYGLLGVLFGFTLVRSEIASWFRMQEMFRFQAPRMYLIIGSALAVAMVSLALLRRSGPTALSGEPVRVPPKDMGRGHRYWIGGGLFGVGWALTGACPGPLFARLGGGLTSMLPVIVAAVAGAWLYGWLRPRLPH